jgi:hypothetical protein
MKPKTFLTGLLCIGMLLAGSGLASAHGLAGKRFFPTTLAVDDPFVSDELSLPLVSHIKEPASGEEPATVKTEFSGEFAKRITPNFGISLEGALLHLNIDEGPTTTGFDNMEVGIKYQFFKSDAHETLMSLALGWDVGGTGQKKVGAESFDSVKPALLFGKGFGDLPDAVWFLKPFAVTGSFGARIPTRQVTRTFTVDEDTGEVEIEKERNPNVFEWGIVFEYSLPYLQSFVKDVGLPKPFSQMILVAELAYDNPLDRGHGGKTTGTVNPGIIWAGKYFQVGLEAIVPVNERTGKNVGVRGVLHFFLDDLFPRSIGRPIFGN